METNIEEITLLWDAAGGNGATITSHTVRVLLGTEEVYTGTSMGTSHSLTRNDLLQGEEDVRRDIDYQVIVTAVNSVGPGEEASETLTIPSGTHMHPFSQCILMH